MDSLYAIAKHSHMTLALLSIFGFILRFIWKQWFPRLLEKKLVRILPHIVDTLLLVFAIWLTTMVPFTHAWLGAKVIGLVVYIVFGMMALKRCTSKTGQYLSFVVAVTVFAWIASVAMSHQPMGFLQPFAGG
ncbi:MAG: SirB2 family protein [Proteobacteria bacterium]|nr:SirB2 family protein [Pseudomonadota bacterium]